jgi:RNA polymerase sigma-70 factor (ECF subfamily)
MAEIEEAVRRFLDGDEEAFNHIVKRWEKKIYNLAWRMLGNREDAQDIVQETFLSVFKSAGGLRDPGSFATWLYRIALNHCRARRRNRVTELYSIASASDPTVKEELFPAAVSSTRHGRETVETLDIIRKALAGLNEDHRIAIVLKEYIGLTLEELANVMDCPLSTAKSRLYHGLRGVQRNLKRMGVKVTES